MVGFNLLSCNPYSFNRVLKCNYLLIPNLANLLDLLRVELTGGTHHHLGTKGDLLVVHQYSGQLVFGQMRLVIQQKMDQPIIGRITL